MQNTKQNIKNKTGLKALAAAVLITAGIAVLSQSAQKTGSKGFAAGNLSESINLCSDSTNIENAPPFLVMADPRISC